MKQLPSLNGLRAISILIVILFHLFRFTLNLDDNIYSRIPIFNGRFGVNIFFVISGFLITHLLLKEEETSGTISLMNFYLRRILRIFPAYLFLLFIYFVLQLLGLIQIPQNAWITALTYTKYLNYQEEYYTSHTWSLSIEENFYLFWPLVIMLGKSMRKDVALWIILIVPFIRLIVFFHPVSWITEQSFFTRLDSIATGCIVALYKTELVAKMSRRWKVFFYCSIATIFIVPWLSFFAQGTYFVLIFVFLGSLTGTIANFSIAVIVLYSIYGPKGKWFKFLNFKILAYIGLLSYSLYLWQQLFIARRSWWITHFPQNIILIFLASAFSYYLIEKPFLRLKSKFSSKNDKTPKHRQFQTTPS